MYLEYSYQIAFTLLSLFVWFRFVYLLNKKFTLLGNGKKFNEFLLFAFTYSRKKNKKFFVFLIKLNFCLYQYFSFSYVIANPILFKLLPF